MTGDGGLDGGLGGVGIANLADHDDVWVETENRAQAFGEGATFGGLDGDLRDAGDAIFDGVLKRDDFAIGGIEGVDDGIKRGGFAGSSGADHEDEAARMADDLLDFGHFLVGESKEVEIKQGFVEIEKSEDGILAVHGGNHFGADVKEVGGAISGDIFLHVAGLGFGTGGGNAGAATEFSHENAIFVATDFGDWVQDAVNTHADANDSTEIFDVDIGGAEPVGLVDEKIEDFVGGNGI